MTFELRTTKEGQSWLVLNDGVKVAAVHKSEDGFILAKDGNVHNLGSARNVRKQLGVKDWEPGEFVESSSIRADLDGYPVDLETYFNAAIEVQRRLPVYTSEPNSKCYFAAGWYRIRVKGRDRVTFCPKLLTLNRNQFWGPFHTESEAENLNQ